MTSMRRTVASALVGATVLGLAACGSDDKSSSSSSSSSSSTKPSAGGAGAQLALTAREPGEEQFAFAPKALEAKAGKVTVKLDNPAADKAPHAIAIEGAGVDADGSVAPPGQTSSVTATLKAGTYTFYCPVGDHREEGMEGKLVVR